MTRRSAGALVVLIVLAASPLASQLIPLGPEFRINQTELLATEAPALALDGSGRLLAAWAEPLDYESDTSNNLLVRVFERNGEPAGPEAVFPTVGNGRKAYPALLALPSGGFALAWEYATPPAQVLPLPPRLGDPDTLSLRILDAEGAPLGQEVRIDQGGQAHGVRLALLPSGQIVATWVAYDVRSQLVTLMKQLFNQDGQPAGTAKNLAYRFDPVPGYFTNDALGSLADGTFLAFWYSDPINTSPPPVRLGWRFTTAGEPAGASFQVQDGAVAIGRDGHFAIAWNSGVDNIDAWLDLYDSGGRLLGPALPVAIGEGDQIVEAAAMDEAGNVLVVWSNEVPGQDPFVDADLSARLFNATGQPLGPAFAVATDAAGDQLGVRVVEKEGEWVISWVTEQGTGNRGNVFARRFASCVTGGTDLCLGGRFRARVTWKAPGVGAGAGTGQAVPLTADTGAFWFFGPENLELVVKALDGRTFNDRYWVFYGALSNVEYDLTVTDAVAGTRRVYHNPAGTLASKADTQAFKPGDTSAPLAVAAMAADTLRRQTAPLTPPPCVPGPDHLCVGSPWQQFQVEVTWRVPGTGQTGTGKAVTLTGETGYFWFFTPGNVELIVKILDGQAINGKHWVFYGALSDVEYTIKVTDKLSGKVKTYHNPAGTMASRADTGAF